MIYKQLIYEKAIRNLSKFKIDYDLRIEYLGFLLINVFYFQKLKLNHIK